jgi:hypothetical protein
MARPNHTPRPHGRGSHGALLPHRRRLRPPPIREIYSRPYMQQHGIRGSGSLKSALDALVASGDVEEAAKGPPHSDRPTARHVGAREDGRALEIVR